ncbi:MAG: phytanoyl-CoA dioxygenase family protein [Gammaproteobacteria bacterium]|nr:phytanoyl-CoA dioxygenase family protein [Gammaproteobacteria bacterium]MYH14606.1 phytanoyl-CoA dioxygenase family protein [Gammaproteobacteria bacterium]MYK27613.1 phytanoyl-CoA dioxygenase family protein [Gammaproteobacteria bacterium]MYK82174.1 phytanoyl-CoA dioxygenase family protein [Gammaproteobacteria bacterium]
MPSAAHRQTKYVAAPPLGGPTPLPLPAPTPDVDQARADLTEYGLCFLTGVLSGAEVGALRERLERQAAAERSLGALAPPGTEGPRQQLSNLVNKGKAFLDLVERPETDALAGYLLGKHFLVSSLTGGLFHGVSSYVQPLHRDQGQVPATADFPAICNLFWLLDDFTPERGSTWVVPGSHRWPPECMVKAPPRELAVQIEAPAGSVFAWDGRVWHGAAANPEGHPRRHVSTFFCLPWMRQQENWGVTCLQEVLDEASPKLKARMGLRTYGTLGMVSGTRTDAEAASLGNYDVEFPEYIIGEEGTLHPLRRVSRSNPTTHCDKRRTSTD